MSASPPRLTASSLPSAVPCHATRVGASGWGGAGRDGGTTHRLSRLLRRRHEWLKGQTARPSVRPRWSRTERICRPKGARSCAAWRRSAPGGRRSRAAARRSVATCPEISARVPEILGKKARDLRARAPRSADFAPKISRRAARDLRPPTRRSRVGFGGARPEIVDQISGRPTTPSGPLLARALPTGVTRIAFRH